MRNKKSEYGFQAAKEEKDSISKHYLKVYAEEKTKKSRETQPPLSPAIAAKVPA